MIGEKDMSDQRPPSNPWIELWKTTVSGAVATCLMTTTAGLIFAGLAFTHGGAEISYNGLNISLSARTPAPPAPPRPPAPPAPPAVASTATPVLAYFPPPESRSTFSRFAIPYLGIRYEQLSRPRAFAFGAASTSAYVHHVYPGSPAAEVGLRAGDRIRAVNSRNLADSRDLQFAVRSAEVGDTILLEVERGGGTLHLPVTLGALSFAGE
jgi:S1-C subfamily serine protease